MREASISKNYDEILPAFTAINQWRAILLEIQSTDETLYYTIVKAYFSLLIEQWYLWNTQLSVIQALDSNNYWGSRENAENLCLLMAFFFQKQWNDTWKLIALLSWKDRKDVALQLQPIFLSIQEIYKKNVSLYTKVKEKYSKELHDRLSLYTAVNQGPHRDIRKDYNQIDPANFFWWAYKNPEVTLLPLSLTDSIILSDPKLFFQTNRISVYFTYHWLLPDDKKISKSSIFTILQRLQPYYETLAELLTQETSSRDAGEIDHDLFDNTRNTIQHRHQIFESDHTQQLCKWRNTKLHKDWIQKYLPIQFTTKSQFIYTKNKYPNLLSKNPSDIAQILIKEWFHQLASEFAEHMWEIFNTYLMNFLQETLDIQDLEENIWWILEINNHTALCIRQLIRMTLEELSSKLWTQVHRDFVINPKGESFINIITPIWHAISLQQWIEIRAYLDPAAWKISYHISNRWLPKEINFLTIDLNISTDTKTNKKINITSDRWSYFSFPTETIKSLQWPKATPYMETIIHNYFLYNTLLLEEQENERKKAVSIDKRIPLLTSSDFTYPHLSYELDEEKISYTPWLITEGEEIRQKDFYQTISVAEDKNSFLSHTPEEIFNFRTTLHKKKKLDVWVSFAKEKWFLADTYHLWTTWIQQQLISYCKWTSRFFLGFNLDSIITIKWQHPNQCYMYRLCYELWIVHWARWKLQPIELLDEKILKFTNSLITECNFLIPNLQDAIKMYSARSIKWWNPYYCHALDDQLNNNL